MQDRESSGQKGRMMRFFSQDIWQIRLRQLARPQYYALLPLKVLFLALRGFGRDRCALRASALTFYSLLSIIPVAALALGVAKGFGLGDNLKRMVARAEAQKVEMRQAPDEAAEAAAGSGFAATSGTLPGIGAVDTGGPANAPAFRITGITPGPGQSEAIEWIIDRADRFLENARGGLFTGLGVVGLFWIIIKLLANIEASFNDIWRVRRGRSLRRKTSDYLSLALLGPILLIISSSLTVFISREMQSLVGESVLLSSASRFFLKLIPYLVIWILFTLIYMIMPNTRVSLKAAVAGGLVAGTIYQVIQKIYVQFQIGVAQYDAVFGSLAALPLFLIWLQMSWIVVLFGAEISFAVDDEETYEPKRDYSHASIRFRKLLALRLAEICIKRFAEGREPLSDIDLCRLTEAPLPLVAHALDRLEDARILSRIRRNGSAENYYQPARSIEDLTIQSVIEALEKQGHDSDHIIKEGEFAVLSAKLEELDRAAAQSPGNLPVKAL